MIRALAWKEWREQRANVVAGLGLAAALPLFVIAGGVAFSSGITARTLADTIPVLFVLLLWPLFALAAGASTFANERAGQTIGFLMSRPIPRTFVWVVKVALAAAATLSVMVGSLVVAQILQAFADRPLGAWLALGHFTSTLDASLAAAFGPAALYLTFASAVFFSTRGSRALTAAAGALVASLLMLAAIIFVSPLLALMLDFQWIWIGVESAIAASLLLLLSLRRFTSLDTSAPSSLPRTAVTLLLILLFTLMLGTAPAIYADVFADLEAGFTRRLTAYPVGDSLIVEANAYPSIFGSIWRIDMREADPSSGPSYLRLTANLAFQSFASPDGRRIYYFSRRGFLGLTKGGIDLRVVDVDGGNDRLVVADVDPRSGSIYWRGFGYSSGGEAVFSPDGTQVALNEGWWGYEPMIISLVDGRVDFVREPDPQRSVELAVIAWGADGKELFVRRRLVDGFRSYRVVVGRYNPDSRQLTPLIESRGRAVSAWPPSGGVAETIASLRQLPVVVRGEEELGSTLLLLDLDAGSTTELVKSECGLTRATIAADGRTMAYRVYRTCGEDEDGYIWYEDPELRVIDLQGGRTREPISFSGRMGIYGFSPMVSVFSLRRNRTTTRAPDTRSSMPMARGTGLTWAATSTVCCRARHTLHNGSTMSD